MDNEDILEAALTAIVEHDSNVPQLLIEYGVDVNRHYNGLGATLMYLACCEGYEATVKVLLESGANINAKSR
jgi:ankyrin repeat protein